MTLDLKRAKVATDLATLAQRRIFEQRSYEFKISLTIWGALGAVLTGLLVTKEIGASLHALMAGVFLTGGVILWAYWYWLSRLVKRYDLFKEQLRYCQRLLAQIAELEYPHHLEPEGALSHWLGLDWGTWPKFIIAAMLWVMALFVVGLRA